MQVVDALPMNGALRLLEEERARRQQHGMTLFPWCPILTPDNTNVLAVVKNFKFGTPPARNLAFLGEASVFVASQHKASCKMSGLLSKLPISLSSQDIVFFPSEDARAIAKKMTYLR